MQIQSDQVPGNFWVGPEKLWVAPKPRNIFQSPEVFKNKSNFLIFMGILQISTNICIKITQISLRSFKMPSIKI